MSILIILILVVIIWWAIESASKLNSLSKAENETFMGKFQGWDMYISPHERGVIALNHEAKRLVVGHVTAYVEHAWSQINAIEIEKNGQSIQQTNRGSQAMGAAVGGLLLGPLGLLIGGLSGSKRTKDRINELSLKILVDDPAAPIHRVMFFKMKGSGVDAKSILLREPAKKMEHFHALLSNAIRSEHRTTFAPQPQPARVEDHAEARIAKLWDLRQAGALTEEEYVSAKKSIVGLETGSARIAELPPVLGDPTL